MMVSVHIVMRFRDLTFEIFSTCWQALVMEMCDSLMAEATAASAAARKEAEDYLQAMYENVIDFITALCVHHRALLLQAQHRNLVTGENSWCPQVMESFVLQVVPMLLKQPYCQCPRPHCAQQQFHHVPCR